MKIHSIILAKRWKNFKTEQTASLYGAVPYCSDAERKDWQVEVVGYTWKLTDGTIGLGRKPVKTYREAEKIMNSFNN